MDVVARPLVEVIQQMDAAGKTYQLIATKPTRWTPDSTPGELYVIRQTLASDGVYQLVTAPKMERG